MGAPLVLAIAVRELEIPVKSIQSLVDAMLDRCNA
jgi:hypothetical protein